MVIDNAADDRMCMAPVLCRCNSWELYAVGDWWRVHRSSLRHYFRTYLSIVVVVSLSGL